jgi:polar amino acid transport system substrate-binding protein
MIREILSDCLAALGRIRRTVMASACGLLALAAAGPASAQLMEQTEAEIEAWRLAEGNVIRFCQFESNLTNDFDRAIGEAIAERLLVDSEFIMLTAGYGVDGGDLETDVFKALHNSCEVMLGFLAAPDLYAPEFAITRPYVNYEYVLAVRDPAYAELNDVPAGLRLGTLLATDGDMALAQEIASRPEGQRWQRLPFGDAASMIERLLDGTIEGALVFGPIYASLLESREDLASGVRLLPVPAHLARTSNIGGLMLVESSYLRLEIDQAIDSMVEDGTIARLLTEHGYGSIAARPGAN